MFAIVKIAGQQFRVQKDQTLFVPHVAGNKGDALEFGEVLLTGADGKVRRRKGFRKKHGHRTRYTQIRISDIV